MTENLISIKSYLGKYYPELSYSAIQEKYKDTKLDTLFEQRFVIQSNKPQLIIDASMAGLSLVVAGNEVHVSKELYDHPGVIVSNSLEKNTTIENQSRLYNPEIFSTISYLICQNHTVLNIVSELDEPIYIRYKSDYETFNNSLITIQVSIGVEAEIVEEVESHCALNAVVNYILEPTAKLNLRTFYQNRISALSFFFRNIVAQDDSTYTHILFGNGSSNVIDENRLTPYHLSNAEFLGVVYSDDSDFHSILSVLPGSDNYSINVDYREIVSENSDVSFFPVIHGQEPSASTEISVSNMTLEELPEIGANIEISNYIKDISDRFRLDRMVGVKRFYDNKAKFLNIL